MLPFVFMLSLVTYHTPR